MKARPTPQYSPFGLLGGSALLFAGVLSPTARGKASEPTFGEVGKILAESCIGCHSNATKSGGLSIESYEALMRGGRSGPAIASGKPADSLIIKRLRGIIKPSMPMGGDPLPNASIQRIEAWIAAGAKNGGAVAGLPAKPKPGEPVTFAHIKPILDRHCIRCHSANGLQGGPSAGLRLDTYEGMLRGGEHAVLVPGMAAASQVFRTATGLSRLRMPADGKSALDREEVALLKAFIDQGAKAPDGRAAPVPVGAEIEIDGRLDANGSLDGLRLDLSRAEFRKSPRRGDWVEVKATVDRSGRLVVRRIKRDD
ncbi:MAG: hypothetical protein K1X67_16715 [Fimbriimonadaceae bacterium]|nr:hypothetical protein [Fimbriimonadaceae bacterium]